MSSWTNCMHSSKDGGSWAGTQPDGDRPSWSGWWLREPRKRPMTGDSLIDFHIGLGGPAQRGFLKRFDILYGQRNLGANGCGEGRHATRW